MLSHRPRITVLLILCRQRKADVLERKQAIGRLATACTTLERLAMNSLDCLRVVRKETRS